MCALANITHRNTNSGMRDKCNKPYGETTDSSNLSALGGKASTVAALAAHLAI